MWQPGSFYNSPMKHRRWLRRRIRKGKRTYVPTGVEQLGKLIICRGIPGSGKSYWAAQQATANENVVVVTRDDIRMEYNCVGAGWSMDKELTYIIPEANTRITKALIAGKTVISADTNLNPHVVDRLIMMAARHGALSELKDFNTPLDVCIARDAAREHPWKVGEVKIREYYKQYEQIVSNRGRVRENLGNTGQEIPAE